MLRGRIVFQVEYQIHAAVRLLHGVDNDKLRCPERIKVDLLRHRTDVYGISFAPQVDLEQLADIRIVVDNQYITHGWSERHDFSFSIAN